MSAAYSDDEFADFLQNQLDALTTLELEGGVGREIREKLALMMAAFIFFLRANGSGLAKENSEIQTISVRLPVNAYNALIKRSIDHEPPMEIQILVAYIIGSDLARSGHFLPHGEFDEAFLDRGSEIGTLIPKNVLDAIDAMKSGGSRQDVIRAILIDWAANTRS